MQTLNLRAKLATGVILAMTLLNPVHASDLTQTVKAILNSAPRDEATARGEDIWQQHADAMKSLMVDPFPSLKELLGDREYAYKAANTMLRLDRCKALSILSLNPPSPVLAEFMTDYFAGRRDPESSNAAHAIALSILENGWGFNEENAILVIGLTGDERDLPLLQHWHSGSGYGGDFGLRLRAATRGAMTRLGYQPALDELKKELARPVPRHPDLKFGEILQNSMRVAAYTGSRELVPVLCEHLTDPTASDSEPADTFVLLSQNAAAALSAIIDGTSPFDFFPRGSKWKAACPTQR